MTRRLGVIAEDQSDIDVLDLVMQKIAKKGFRIQKFVGNGCGRIQGKCRSWAENLRRQGCDLLVLLHDLDNKNLLGLRQDIQNALNPSPIPSHIIVIPVHELEAWLLADHDAIVRALKLRKRIKQIPNPEAILRPKEYLRDLVYQRSQKTIRYINTVHNRQIAGKVSVSNLRRCPSFVPLEKFAKAHL